MLLCLCFISDEDEQRDTQTDDLVTETLVPMANKDMSLPPSAEDDDMSADEEDDTHDEPNVFDVEEELETRKVCAHLLPLLASSLI